LATRVRDLAFYIEWYARLAEEAGLARAMNADLPQGVTAQVRTDGELDYVFVQNFTPSEQTVPLDSESYTYVESGQSAGDRLRLPAYGLAIVRRAMR
jgi:beta-galactosidase